MTPANQFLLDGNHAWWVKSKLTFDGAGGQTLADLDRPCGRCYGDGKILVVNQGEEPCPARCIDGRHTFEIEVRASGPVSCERHDPCDCTCYSGMPHCRMGCGYDDISSWPTTAYRASIVPGMVLPMFEWCPDYKPADHLCDCYQDGKWTHHSKGGPFDETETMVSLPPAAAPGMWAVKLKVLDG